jgi:hypothetical protein
MHATSMPALVEHRIQIRTVGHVTKLTKTKAHQTIRDWLQRSPKVTHLCSRRVIHSESTIFESNLEFESGSPRARRPGAGLADQLTGTGSTVVGSSQGRFAPLQLRSRQLGRRVGLSSGVGERRTAVAPRKPRQIMRTLRLSVGLRGSSSASWRAWAPTCSPEVTHLTAQTQRTNLRSEEIERNTQRSARAIESLCRFVIGI